MQNQPFASKAQVRSAVERQLQRYPASSLVDVYKSFFQDEYGPGHLLKDPDAARKQFYRELSEMTSRGRCTLEPCGLGRRFFRATMDCAADGIIDPDDFFEEFLSSASRFSLPDADVWRQRWRDILSAIKPLHCRIPDADKDAERIQDYLASGCMTMHHSRRYHQLYDPHYRIISIESPLFCRISQLNRQ